MAVITIAGERLIAQKQQAKEPLVISEFVLAYVPSVDPSKPPQRNQSLPPSSQIAFRIAPTRSAVVNDNEVVYSLILDNTIGNFHFNWLGLLSEEGVLVSANHMVVQSKRKNNELSGEEGNNLTRNFLLKFSGAQAITNIKVTPETWQFNYEAKLNDMDALIARLSAGLISTQKIIVAQSHENMTLHESNRTLQASLNDLDADIRKSEQKQEAMRIELIRANGLAYQQRIEVDTALVSALIDTQQGVVQLEHSLMKLSEQVRVMENQNE
jgi:hypothetical protein